MIEYFVKLCATLIIHQISIIEFNEETNQLDNVSLYEHEEEVWALETSPEDEDLLVTSRYHPSFLPFHHIYSSIDDHTI